MSNRFHFHKNSTAVTIHDCFINIIKIDNTSLCIYFIVTIFLVMMLHHISMMETI